MKAPFPISTDAPAMTVLLACMTAIGPLTMDIYLASIPQIGIAMGASVASVQLTITLYIAGFALGQVVYGPLSDVLGRRPPLLIGLALYLFATTVCAFADSIEWLIAARVLQALGAAGPIILARAIVRDLYAGSRAARQFGLMSTIMGITPIAAPVAGGMLQAAFGWRAAFVAMGAVGLAMATLALLRLPETRPPRAGAALSPRTMAASFASVIAHRGYRSHVMLISASYVGVFAFLSGSSHVLQQVFGLSAVEFGLVFGLCSACYIVGNYVGSRLVGRKGIETMLGIGVRLMAAAGMLQVLAYWMAPDRVAALVVPQMLFFFGCAFLVPQAMAGALTPFPERAGAASSLMGVIQMTSASIVGTVMALALGRSAWPQVGVLAACGLLALAVYTGTARHRRDAAEGSI